MDWGSKKKTGSKKENPWKGKEQKWVPTRDPDAWRRPSESTADTEKQEPAKKKEEPAKKKEWECICEKNKNRAGWYKT